MIDDLAGQLAWQELSEEAAAILGDRYVPVELCPHKEKYNNRVVGSADATNSEMYALGFVDIQGRPFHIPSIGKIMVGNYPHSTTGWVTPEFVKRYWVDWL